MFTNKKDATLYAVKISDWFWYIYICIYKFSWSNLSTFNMFLGFMVAELRKYRYLKLLDRIMGIKRDVFGFNTSIYLWVCCCRRCTSYTLTTVRLIQTRLLLLVTRLMPSLACSIWVWVSTLSGRGVLRGRFNPLDPIRGSQQAKILECRAIEGCCRNWRLRMTDGGQTMGTSNVSNCIIPYS